MSSRLLFFCLFTLILTLFGWVTLPAQGVNLGIPPMRNFPKKAYGAGTQNWDAAQDKHGVMYWANNEGLLRYDGTFWTCLPVANNTIVRSVAIDKQGRIFVGAQNELGYFAPEHNGRLAYHSLSGLLPKAQRNFEDVWDIVFSGGDVFFRTNKVVFQYTGGKIFIHTPGGELTALFSTLRGLLLQKDLNQLLSFSNGKFQPFLQVPELKSALTGYREPTHDTLLLSSLKDGLFCLNGKNEFSRWTTSNDALLQNNRIYCSTTLPNGQWALGTSLNGLIVLDGKGRVYRHLTKKSGLQNNNILCAFSDMSGNLWLGLDNGIDCVVLDSPFTSLIPDGYLQGTGYAAALFQNQLYLGVSNGVYLAPWQTFYNPEQEPFFQKVPFPDGQVWSLNTTDNNLILGHHEGAFRLSGNKAARMSTEPGAWTFVQLTDEYLLGGTYNGLVLYKKNGVGWVFDQKMEGLNESCRIMVKDADGSVWISHPYRGLYHIFWSPENKNKLKVSFYNAANGLPSDLNNYVFQIAGKAVVATQKGVCRFDNSSGRFVPDEDFNRLLGTDHRVRYLREDSKGNVWYATSQEVGMLQVNDFGLKKEVQKKVFPELTGKLVGGFEFIYPIDSKNVIIGAEQGFILYNSELWAGRNDKLQIILSSIHARGNRDSLLFESGVPDPSETIVLDADMNNLLFSFSATDYKNPQHMLYRVQLVGQDRDWSDWVPETKRNYTGLQPGKYTFNLQARLKDGRESEIVAFTFRIRPPWYASTVALVLYALAILGLFAWLLIRQRQKFELEKTQLRVKHQEKQAEQQREVEQSKAALTDILNEKLETEIKYKNQELASATMHLVQKGEILLTVQEALDRILEKSTNPGVKKDIQQLLNLLNSDTKLDEDWEQFAFHFDQVHVDFLKRLREQFPQLSLNDHKLSAYLRMNLSTKEIAPLMNISVRGVEASRYRLRKKLDLPNDANLTEFMMEV